MCSREQAASLKTVDRLSRRDFVKAIGVATAAGSVLVPTIPAVAHSASHDRRAKIAVKQLYTTLTPEQKQVVALSWDDPKRTRVSPNWKITKATVGDFFRADQQELIRDILKAITSEEGYEKFMKQMAVDWAPGLPRYTVAIFGNPGTDTFQFTLTGRHLTIRADGRPSKKTAFGGPIVYGPAPKATESSKHPGNVFWYQAKRANEVFQMLDGRQRKEALLDRAPVETAISLRQSGKLFPGIAGSELAPDQKRLLQAVLTDVLAPYGKTDVDEAMRLIQAGGGLDTVHISFYKKTASGYPDGDIGRDGVWDIWRLESPTLVSHFRGAPHVHAYFHAGRRE